jgi:hypothetical protein
LAQAQVLDIASREGWVARVCDRKFFKLIELWLENQFLLEIMTEEEAKRYGQFTTLDNWRSVIEHEPMPLQRFGYADNWLSGPPKP